MTAAAEFPLRIGAPDDFARARQFFHAAGYDDQAVCRALAIRQISDIDGVDWDKVAHGALPAAQHWCLAVFLRGLASPASASRAICGDDTIDALMALGLLRPSKRQPDMLVCPVWLYPVDGFLVASDRRDDPDGDTYVAPDDVVFPGLYSGTLKFLRLMPDVHGGAALDLCGGCGIGALHLSRTARAAATADITERSARFAAFAARLNDVAVSSLCGDLYAPAGDASFDVITAHPPYIPATGKGFVFRDGGDTGEAITRRTIEGIPAHLKIGGTAMIVCAASDTAQQTFEQRARGWLGEAGAEFDIVFGLEKTLTVDDVVAYSQNRWQPMAAAEAETLRARLRALDTEQFVYGALVMRRCAEAVEDAPLRVRTDGAVTAADFDRLLRWRAWRRRAEFPQWLASAKPRLAPQLELNAKHVVRDGELVPAEFLFVIESGIRAALRTDPWMVPVIAGLDAKRSVADVFAAARDAGRLPEGFGLGDLAGLVALMIERGFLDVDFG